MAARSYHQEALDIFDEIGQKAHVALSADNLGHVASALGDYAAALSSYHMALQMTTDLGIIPLTLDSLAGVAGVWARTGQTERALDVLGVVFHHPALLSESRLIVEQVLADLRAQLSPEEVEAGLERGKSLKIETVVAEICERVLESSSGYC